MNKYSIRLSKVVRPWDTYDLPSGKKTMWKESRTPMRDGVKESDT